MKKKFILFSPWLLESPATRTFNTSILQAPTTIQARGMICDIDALPNLPKRFTQKSQTLNSATLKLNSSKSYLILNPKPSTLNPNPPP